MKLLEQDCGWCGYYFKSDKRESYCCDEHRKLARNARDRSRRARKNILAAFRSGVLTPEEFNQKWAVAGFMTPILRISMDREHAEMLSSKMKAWFQRQSLVTGLMIRLWIDERMKTYASGKPGPASRR